MVDPVAAKELGEVTARISRLEGMEGHARQADARLLKYLGKEAFDSLDLSASGVGAENTDQLSKVHNDAATLRAAASNAVQTHPRL